MSVSDAKPKRKRRPKPGDVASLRRVLWDAIRKVEHLTETGDPDTVLRAVSALSTAAGVYLKCSAEHGFERELADIRKELHDAIASARRPPRQGPSARATEVN